NSKLLRARATYGSAASTCPSSSVPGLHRWVHAPPISRSTEASFGLAQSDSASTKTRRDRRGGAASSAVFVFVDADALPTQADEALNVAIARGHLVGLPAHRRGRGETVQRSQDDRRDGLDGACGDSTLSPRSREPAYEG